MFILSLAEEALPARAMLWPNSLDRNGNAGAIQRLSRCTAAGSTIGETDAVQQRSRWRVPALQWIASKQLPRPKTAVLQKKE